MDVKRYKQIEEWFYENAVQGDVWNVIDELLLELRTSDPRLFLELRDRVVDVVENEDEEINDEC